MGTRAIVANWKELASCAILLTGEAIEHGANKTVITSITREVVEMKRFGLVLAMGAALGAGSLAVGTAQGMPLNGLSADAANASAIIKTQFYIFGGRHYCFYIDGWRGPGWYWCGYAQRRGFGWGGPRGWHGWGGGGYRGGRGGRPMMRGGMGHGSMGHGGMGRGGIGHGGMGHGGGGHGGHR
jgi:hypothetical protein